MLKALQGQSPTELAAVARALQVSANAQPELAGVFSTFAAETPQVHLDIDRDKAQVLGVKVSDIFNALQSTLGGFYINDFNLFGRTWQVNVQADSHFRDAIDDIYRVYVRTSAGTMVPIRALAQARLIQGPQAVIRYNGSRAAVINGGPRPGFSSGQAIAAMERLSATTLPAGYGFEWTGTAFQEKAAGGQTGIVLGLAVLFAYLFLVALYESWNIPLPVLLSVTVGLLGGDRRRPAVRPGVRRLCADRPGRAGGAGGQEQHPDRRVRRAATKRRQVDSRVGDRRRAAALPSGDDDQLRLHPRPAPAGDRGRPERAQPPRDRHACVRRHDRGGVRRDLPDPVAVRRVPAPARERVVAKASAG